MLGLFKFSILWKAMTFRFYESQKFATYFVRNEGDVGTVTQMLISYLVTLFCLATCDTPHMGPPYSNMGKKLSPSELYFLTNHGGLFGYFFVILSQAKRSQRS